MSEVVAYLYHDANTPQDAHPWLHSTMLVLAADRRPELRNETPLVTLAQAEAMVAAERERLLSELRMMHAQVSGRHTYYLYAAEMLAGKL